MRSIDPFFLRYVTTFANLGFPLTMIIIFLALASLHMLRIAS